MFFALTALLMLATPSLAAAQDAPAPESRRDFRYALAVIDDATFDSNLQVPLPKLLNQVLVEPTLTLRYKPAWSFSTSLVGVTDRYTDTFTQIRVKETYAGFSAGDFDFTLGRRIVRWGTGYAFTAAGVLDPPRIPTNPTDRLNLNEGRDMVKADYVHGPHALSVAWSPSDGEDTGPSTPLGAKNAPNSAQDDSGFLDTELPDHSGTDAHFL